MKQIDNFDFADFEKKVLAGFWVDEDTTAASAAQTYAERLQVRWLREYDDARA